MTASSLAPFFAPRSVAVIGASRDPSKVGGSVLANLRSAGFGGRVIPVNTRAEVVQGLAAVPSLLDVDGSVDLAVITVPAPAVLPALKECVSKGVRGAVVITAGFRESNAEGRQREAELRHWLSEQPLRLLGPNCLGWIRPSHRLNVTFAPGMPEPGGIAFISHSGALAVAILDWARERRMGFSLFASLGNQADLNESDLLAAVAADAETRVVAAYIEGVADGQRFFEALRTTASVKPVVVLKTGRTAEGARAVSSHTGALAGSDRAFDAAVRQAGAVRASSVEELFDLARGLASQPLPPGRRLLVVTNGGGLGIVATDAAREAGLEVAPLDDAVRGRLAAALPPTASLGNPVDLVGDADAARYSHALHAVGDDSADAAVVVLTAQATTDSAGIARAIIGATRGWRVPVVAALVGGARVAPGARALEDAGIPCYSFPEPAVQTLASMALLGERRPARFEAIPAPAAPAEAQALRARLRTAGPGALGLVDLQAALEAYGIVCAAGRPARTGEEAAAVAERIGFPVALKVISPDISHKTEVGGVRLGLRSAAEVSAAAGDMLRSVTAARPQAVIQGLLVQPMVAAGKELLLGMVRDLQFGPLVMVGFGGIYVEVLKDTATRLAPVSAAEAAAMLDELRMAPALRGVRGEAPVSREALVRTICAFARLTVDVPELAEIEVNPLVATPEGTIAVDARGRVTSPHPALSPEGTGMQKPRGERETEPRQGAV
ncbi:MAG TPA: acetate--CoA ligase family protein [Methylomirabilota bacterium]|nr:acetate--CoA ligase family protein [Methylomirabilota bacterium]